MGGPMVAASSAQLRRDGERAAGALAGLGVRPGDRVAMVSPEVHPDRGSAAAGQARFVATVWGALRAGFVPVPVNPHLPAAERAAILADCAPTITMTGADDLAALERLRPAAVELADHPQGRPMHYTSGTTGRSKGVWTGDLTAAQSAALWADEADQWGYGPDDSTLVHGPLCHSGPLRFALSVALAGGSVVLTGGFETAAIARATAAARPTVAFMVPTHLQRLLAADPPPSPYRLLAHAGAACPPELKQRIHAWAGSARTWEFYGATEGQFAACSGPEWEQRPGTVGRARPGRRLFTDQGVIWCEAPPFASFRYYGDDDKTGRAWRATSTGRAFTVGDLGRLDDDGYLFIDGRREDLIITGGVNVYPAQVEAVLSRCPGVEEVAVFARPDPQWGQAVCAAYVGPARPRDVHVFAAANLAGYARPKHIDRRPDLPHNASGKLVRRRLR